MNKFFLSLIVYFFIIYVSYSNHCNWAIQNSSAAQSIAIDSAGYIYSIGSFSDSNCVFSQFISLSNIGSLDSYIAKYDGETCLWANRIAGVNSDYIYNVATDKNGNVFVTGFFYSPVLYFNNNISLSSSENGDIFLAKYDSSGVCQWAEIVSGDSDDLSYGLLVDGNDDIYIAGYYYSTTLYFNSGISIDKYKYMDGFLAKYNNNGKCLWAEPIGGYGQDFPMAIAKDNSDNIYIVGYFYGGTIDFNNNYYLMNYNGADGFLAKYNSSGLCQWATRIAGQYLDAAYNIAISNDNIIRVTGVFGSPTLYTGNNEEIITNHSYQEDLFCIAYDVSGAYISSHYLIGHFDSYMHGQYIAYDNNGNYFLTGTFKEVDLDIDRTTILPIYANTDIFVAKFDANDELLWSKRIDGNAYDYANGILVTKDNKVLLTGIFNSLILNISNDIKLNNTGYYTYDGFIANITNCDEGKKAQSIPLTSGWNLISTNIIPENDSIAVIFNEIKNSVVLVKNNAGNVYLPSGGIDLIKKWDEFSGYQVYMNDDATLDIVGELVEPENAEINLSSGWNILPYLRKTPQDISVSLAPLVVDNSLVIAKTISGQIYMPSLSINNIGDMTPGGGYQAYLANSKSFYYPANNVDKKLSSKKTPVANFLKSEFYRTGNSAVLIIDIKATDGNELAIFNENGSIIGTGAVYNNRAAVTIWGDNLQTNEVDGANYNENLIVKLYDIYNNNFKNIEITNLSEFISGESLRELKYSQDAVFLAKGNVDDFLNELTLNISPNPVSNNIEISFITSDCNSTTLKLYDMYGRIIKDFLTEIANYNNQSIKANLANLANGEYTITLTCGKEIISKNVIIMK